MTAVVETVEVDRAELLDFKTDLGALSLYVMKYLHTEWDAPVVTRIMDVKARLQIVLGLARRDVDGQVVAVDEETQSDRLDGESVRAREWIARDLDWLIQGGREA